MPTDDEKMAFAARLRFALARRLRKHVGATALAAQFNRHYEGARRISPQTAHKWLTGRTIPTEAKLRVFADWLQVDLHWLHYGPSSGSFVRKSALPRIGENARPPTAETLELAAKIEALPPHQRYLIEELVAQFDSRFIGK